MGRPRKIIFAIHAAVATRADASPREMDERHFRANEARSLKKTADDRGKPSSASNREDGDMAQIAKNATSRKLNFLKAARFDRTISAFDKLVLAALADHMNKHSGQTWPVADETIALEIGSGRRSVRRSRMKLRKAGYLTWHRTRTSNVYGFDFTKAKATLEMLASLKKNAMRGDSRVLSGGTPESPIPVISPVKEESPKGGGARERELRLMRVVGGRS